MDGEERNLTQYNGWWNPLGTSIFRFASTKIVSLRNRDGTRVTDSSADPVFSLTVGNSPDQSSAKIVDLDPDWQNASEIYGLSVSFNDPKGQPVFTGRFASAPFRDLWFARSSAPGDMGASASYQSILTDFEWHIDDLQSGFLESLRDEADRTDALSIRFTTYNYEGIKKAVAR
jgi:hypothetical protein